MSDHPRVVAALEQLQNGATTLNLGGNNIGPEGAKAVAAALKENQSLTSLDLGGNNIGPEGAKAVAAALKENRSLTSLDLGGNNIGPEGAKAVVAALKENRSLSSLDLRSNRIGLKGAKAMAVVLKENQSLTSLYLYGNDIGDEGAKAVAAALKENWSLKSLSLYLNDIGDEGAKAVAAALKENRSLTSLSLGGNNIGPEGAKAVAAALKENRSLTSLYLERNKIGSEGAEEVAAALNENHVLQKIILDNDVPENVKAHMWCLKLANDIVNEFAESAMNAFSQDEKVRWGRAKLMVVGKGGAGKTSTIRTLLGQAFVVEHKSTIGIELKMIRTKDWKEDPMPNHSVYLSEDLAKHQLFKRQENFLSNNAHAKKRPRLESSTAPPLDDDSKLKIDIKEVRKSFRADVKLQLENKGRQMVETDISFSIWDYGGQEVFYALHHLFLTKYGTYVIVFDMRELIGKHNFQDCPDYDFMQDSETALNTIRFWLDSIRLHVNRAKVVLVGTFLDALRDAKENLKLINAKLRKIFSQAEGLRLVRNTTDGLYFHPLDNTERQDASRRELLRQFLMTTAASEPYVQEEVPLRWSLCFDRMFKTKKDYLELDAVYELAMGSCGISKGDATKMLKYMHELGVIVHLTSTPVLANYVVLQPQWLLDNLSRVICDPMHMEVHVQKMEEASLEADIPTDWFRDLDTWEERGVASRLFLSTLWGQPFLVEYFSKLMTEMLLASRSPWIGDLDAEGALLIPSLLKTISEDELNDLLSQFEGAALVYIEFDFFPKGVIQRFIASMVSNFPEGLVEVQQVYANAASIIFDGIYVLLVPDDTRRRIIMYFENDEENESSDLQRPLTNIVQLLHAQLQSIDEAFMKQKLNPSLFLSCDGTTNDQSCASISDLAKPQRGNKVSSVGRKKRLRLSSFRLFFANRDEAEEIESKITAQREEKYDVFLSHAWGNDQTVHSFVCRVSGDLQNNHGISCWLDRNEVQHGEITRIMTQGIDDSKVGVVFVTREYMEKVNSDPAREDYCRYEFEYLVKRKSRVRMIPVVLEQAMTDTSKWEGVFGGSWGINPLYVNMTSGGSPSEIKELHDMVRHVLSQIEKSRLS